MLRGSFLGILHQVKWTILLNTMRNIQQWELRQLVAHIKFSHKEESDKCWCPAVFLLLI